MIDEDFLARCFYERLGERRRQGKMKNRDITLSLLRPLGELEDLAREVIVDMQRKHVGVQAGSTQDVADAEVVQLTARVLNQAIRLLERHPLHTLDALHVGCALEWEAEAFVSSDQRQLAAASANGLHTVEL